METEKIRPLVWMGSSLEDLKEFPEAVKDEIPHVFLSMTISLMCLFFGVWFLVFARSVASKLPTTDVSSKI